MHFLFCPFFHIFVISVFILVIMDQLWKGNSYFKIKLMNQLFSSQAWIDRYPARRYGISVPLIQEAWNVLYHTVYNCTDGAYVSSCQVMFFSSKHRRNQLPSLQAHLYQVLYISLMYKQDKNRDVIVAFPDVDPSIISIAQGRYHHYDKPVLRSAVLKSNPSSYDQPHLWYSTSEVIRALELFIASGEQLSASNTYRLALFSSRVSNTLSRAFYHTPVPFLNCHIHFPVPCTVCLGMI